MTAARYCEEIRDYLLINNSTFSTMFVVTFFGENVVTGWFSLSASQAQGPLAQIHRVLAFSLHSERDQPLRGE